MHRSRQIALDVAMVLAFVVMGLRTHDEPTRLADVVTTAAPFLAGLAVGWLVTRRLPDLSPGRGALIGLVTVAIGMATRNLMFGDGTAASFVAVATAFLVGSLTGWRWLARRRSFAAGASQS